MCRRGEAIKDSDTGEIIGNSEENIGIVEVVEVQAKISKATFVSGPPADMSNPKTMVVRRSQALAGGTSGAKVGVSTVSASASASASVTAGISQSGVAPQVARPQPSSSKNVPKEGVDF